MIEKKKGKTPKAKKLRQKRKAKPAPKKRARSRIPQGENPTGGPVKDVKVEPVPEQLEGLSCKSKGTCQKGVKNVVTWLYWHKGQWRQAKRILCGRHSGGLANRLNQAEAR